MLKTIAFVVAILFLVLFLVLLDQHTPTPYPRIDQILR